MSKSELKRLCAQNPVEMAERIVELEHRVKVLTGAIHLAQIASCSCATMTNEISHHSEHCLYRILGEALDATPQQTAEQIERWHVEWMKTLPVAGVIEQSNFGNPQQVHLVAIPQPPETKEPTK